MEVNQVKIQTDMTYILIFQAFHNQPFQLVLIYAVNISEKEREREQERLKRRGEEEEETEFEECSVLA